MWLGVGWGLGVPGVVWSIMVLCSVMWCGVVWCGVGVGVLLYCLYECMHPLHTLSRTHTHTHMHMHMHMHTSPCVLAKQ